MTETSNSPPNSRIEYGCTEGEGEGEDPQKSGDNILKAAQGAMDAIDREYQAMDRKAAVARLLNDLQSRMGFKDEYRDLVTEKLSSWLELLERDGLIKDFRFVGIQPGESGTFNVVFPNKGKEELIATLSEPILRGYKLKRQTDEMSAFYKRSLNEEEQALGSKNFNKLDETNAAGRALKGWALRLIGDPIEEAKMNAVYDIGNTLAFLGLEVAEMQLLEQNQQTTRISLKTKTMNGKSIVFELNLVTGSFARSTITIQNGGRLVTAAKWFSGMPLIKNWIPATSYSLDILLDLNQLETLKNRLKFV